ncbi:MAG TPA: hypothetical protein VIM51_14990 [Desulfosporosinus sp.]
MISVLVQLKLNEWVSRNWINGLQTRLEVKKTWLAPEDTVFARISHSVSLQAPAMALVALMLPESIQLKVILSD